MLADLRFALRGLRRNPGFAAIAILTLALGIGANSAIFSVVHAVLLRPLPFDQPERLVQLFHVWEGSREYMSPANAADVREQSSSLEDVAFYLPGSVTLSDPGEPARLETTRVSEGFFQVLRARPLLGRMLLPEDNAPGGHRVAVLSHALWQQRFGGDPGVVGRTVAINGEPHEVVAVMPAAATYPEGTELWLPHEYPGGLIGGGNRAAWYVSALGRLRSGVGIEQAKAEIEAIGRRLEAAYPEANARMGITAVPLHEVLVGDLRRPLLVLLGAVGMVLLIACANVANLLLARASTRETELAVRTAIGAGRGRLTRQLLTESVVLGVAGGVVGLGLAAWGTRVLLALAPADLPRLEQVGLDANVVLFTAAISILTGLLFGVLPALQLRTDALLPVLRAAGRGQFGDSRGRRARNAFVVAEMAFAVMLLVAAGLLIRSFVHLHQVDAGFRSEGVQTFRLSLPASEYDNDEKLTAFYTAALDQLGEIPGVTAAAATHKLPMKEGGLSLTFDVHGRPAVAPGHELSSSVLVTTPEYFRTLGIPLLRGREPEEGDRGRAAVAFVISEEAARRFFPGENALGQQITLHWGSDSEQPTGTVVGVVGDVRNRDLIGEPEPTIYLPHAQRPVASMDVALRSSTDRESLMRAATAVIAGLDPKLPVYEVQSLESIVAESIAGPRFYTLLLAIFGVVALLLAAIGIFGVLSYSMRQRTREIGVRIALGAEPSRILAMVVRNAAMLAGLGLAIGMAGAFVGSRLLAGLLYGVTSADPLTFAGVAALLMGVALLASFVPARSATRVEPAVTLRDG